MIRKMSLILIIILLFFGGLQTVVQCEVVRNTTVTWDHPGAEDLAGFDMRINGDPSALFMIEPAARSWSGEVTFFDSENVIDMRARDLAGQKSEWSEPCYYDPVPDPPVIEISIMRTPR